MEVKFHIIKQYAYQRVIRDYNNANYVGLNNYLTATNLEEDVFFSENIHEINSNYTYYNLMHKKNKFLLKLLQFALETKHAHL